MGILSTRTAKRRCSSLMESFTARLLPRLWMKKYELKFWNKKAEDEGTLRNDHFKYFYTEHFGLDDASYDGKCVLDIGCGPRGSLEWANMASRRIGVDPLVSEYLRLGADRHEMEYIEAPSESIPLDRAECDIVCAFNCFDHFIDIERSIAEVKRVTRPGGLFLLLVEVNQAESK